jgi:hypothetical protein
MKVDEQVGAKLRRAGPVVGGCQVVVDGGLRSRTVFVDRDGGHKSKLPASRKTPLAPGQQRRSTTVRDVQNHRNAPCDFLER